MNYKVSGFNAIIKADQAIEAVYERGRIFSEISVIYTIKLAAKSKR
jgi:hypothetical protein